MISEHLVDLSRLQFAITALYHFLFVPLTIGLALLLVIMETAYVLTGQKIYQDMVKFWGKLFGINFALGVTTGLTMEFQFGTNWAYYSQYVGDIFGAPLAIEGMMAFFLESTFIGLFFFGWNRLSKNKHLLITVLMAIGSNLSALWILIANAWMQHPVGAHFNFTTMRMELTNFWAVVFNPTAQAKVLHTVSASYVMGSVFVLGISSYYLLKKRDVEFARRSFRIAAAFGLAASLSVIVMGDDSGYIIAKSQPSKLDAIEAMWHTEPAPAALTLFALPDQKTQSNRYSITVPYLMGLLGTRSLTGIIPGIAEIKEKNRHRIEDGIIAVTALQQLRRNPHDAQAKSLFEAHQKNLGYGLLLKQYTPNVSQATPQMIQKAVNDTIPEVAPVFWSFRIMVGLGFSFLALFAVAFYYSARDTFINKRWLLRWAVLFIPLPWVAAELGWVVSEYGRQPWSIYGVLPTALSTSSLSTLSLYMSITGFVVFYTGLLIAELYLMLKYARQGPGSLGTGRYANEPLHVTTIEA